MNIPVTYRTEILVGIGVLTGIVITGLITFIVYEFLLYYKNMKMTPNERVRRFLKDIEKFKSVNPGQDVPQNVSSDSLNTYMKDIADAISLCYHSQEDYDYMILCIHRQLRKEAIESLSPGSKLFIQKIISRNKATFLDEFYLGVK